MPIRLVELGNSLTAVCTWILGQTRATIHVQSCPGGDRWLRCTPDVPWRVDSVLAAWKMPALYAARHDPCLATERLLDNST